MKFNLKEFGLDVWRKRTYANNKANHIPLRQAAKEIGISITTLHTIENGQMPSIPHFLRICTWLKVKPQTYFE